MASAVRATISLLAGSATSAIGAQNLFETCTKNCATCSNYGACHQGFDMGTDFDFGTSKSSGKSGSGFGVGTDYTQSFSGDFGGIGGNSSVGANSGGYFNSNYQQRVGLGDVVIEGKKESQNKDSGIVSVGKNILNERKEKKHDGKTVRLNSSGMTDPTLVNFGYTKFGGSKV